MSKSSVKSVFEFGKSVFIAILVALTLRAFVVEAFKIPSGSMIPTLSIGDQIFVNKTVFGIRVPFTSIRLVNFALPKRGDVVVFIVPIEPHDDFIKRVIGLPGDKIQVTRGVISINGRPLEHTPFERVSYWDKDGATGEWRKVEAYATHETLGEHTYQVLYDSNISQSVPDFGPIIVPKDTVFTMGDNRDHSYDSRFWGPVPQNNILGRAMFVWWSWGPGGTGFLGDVGLVFKRLGTWID